MDIDTGEGSPYVVFGYQRLRRPTALGCAAGQHTKPVPGALSELGLVKLPTLKYGP